MSIVAIAHEVSSISHVVCAYQMSLLSDPTHGLYAWIVSSETPRNDTSKLFAKLILVQN